MDIIFKKLPRRDSIYNKCKSELQHEYYMKWAASVWDQTIVIFYTEILTGKVVLWCFFSSEMSEKIHNSTFQVKISV